MADGGDPLEEIDQAIAMWQMEKAMYQKDKDRGKEMEEMRRGHIVRSIARNYEVLVGAGEFDDADKAAKKLLEFEKSAQSYSALIKCAARARSHELADELTRQAQRDLPEDERDKVITAEELAGDSDEEDSPDDRSPPDGK